MAMNECSVAAGAGLDPAVALFHSLSDGTRLLDFTSGLLCTNAGHRNPRIRDAIVDALDRLGLSQNTLLMFGSDNGPEFRRPWRGTAGPWTGTYGVRVRVLRRGVLPRIMQGTGERIHVTFIVCRRGTTCDVEKASQTRSPRRGVGVEPGPPLASGGTRF